MEVWRKHMPKGMLLKSDGFASNLSDPEDDFTLAHFCEARGIPYDDTRVPVALDTFVEYALAFQKKLVPQLDTRRVAAVNRVNGHFTVHTKDEETVPAKRVIVAVGISHFSYVPEMLASLPKDRVCHSSAVNDCSVYAGKKVAVIGAGASAIDVAALLHESGADVTIIARANQIKFHTGPGDARRTLLQRMRNPSSGLGPGWKSRFYTEAPGIFRYFPEQQRLRIVREHLGPAPGWPMKERVMGKVPMLLGREITQAQPTGAGVLLTLMTRDGKTEEHETEHVIAATGYRPDLRRLDFLPEAVRSQIQTIANAPDLSPNFQSTIPGLYFVGIAAANTFGPMMRFAYGSDYTARRLARHLETKVIG